MKAFKKYKRTAITELRPYDPGENLDEQNVTIDLRDIRNGSPKEGDYVARDVKSPDKLWLISAEDFKDNFKLVAKKKKKAVSTTTTSTTEIVKEEKPKAKASNTAKSKASTKSKAKKDGK